jgi:alkyl hydroperoxide reductase subunit AhpC
MSLQLGDSAPDFHADTTEGRIRFYDWMNGDWAVLFSHPKDFTPVCTTELAEVARLKSRFDRRNVKVIGLSVDPLDAHKRWASDIKETQGYSLNFPLIADEDLRVSTLYGMIHPNAAAAETVRAVFVIGADKRVKLMITYPATTGRNFEEILRVIDSLQLTEDFDVATPVNWSYGDDVIIIPALTDKEAREQFPAGWDNVRPYMRVIHQPSRGH